MNATADHGRWRRTLPAQGSDRGFGALHLALPQAFRTCRGKRLRLCFFNVAARVTRSARRLHLRLPRAYGYANAFITAIERLRALPAFA
ncbi:MAG: transposase [Acidimicrobiales bacterium]